MRKSTRFRLSAWNAMYAKYTSAYQQPNMYHSTACLSFAFRSIMVYWCELCNLFIAIYFNICSARRYFPYSFICQSCWTARFHPEWSNKCSSNLNHNPKLDFWMEIAVETLENVFRTTFNRIHTTLTLGLDRLLSRYTAVSKWWAIKCHTWNWYNNTADFNGTKFNRKIVFKLPIKCDKLLREILRGFPSVFLQQIVWSPSAVQMIGQTWTMSFK